MYLFLFYQSRELRLFHCRDAFQLAESIIEPPMMLDAAITAQNVAGQSGEGGS